MAQRSCNRIVGYTLIAIVPVQQILLRCHAQRFHADKPKRMKRRHGYHYPRHAMRHDAIHHVKRCAIPIYALAFFQLAALLVKCRAVLRYPIAHPLADGFKFLLFIHFQAAYPRIKISQPNFPISTTSAIINPTRKNFVPPRIASQEPTKPPQKFAAANGNAQAHTI